MKVLIVDDDDGIIDFVRPELKHEGFETDVAKTGREALEKIESEKPDIVLLDVMLPEINGLEVLRRIRQIGDLPVILVTARGETLDKINGLNSGADDYISKPFDI
ncbi:MAG: response regulator, partial [Treponema sp.]|nr:response regulator [Treponema sp.]